MRRNRFWPLLLGTIFLLTGAESLLLASPRSILEIAGVFLVAVGVGELSFFATHLSGPARVAPGSTVVTTGAIGPPPPPSCPRCGRPAYFEAQFGRYYCPDDKKYI